MPSLKYKPVKTINWRGLKIAIENPAGSVREGVSKTGKKWSTTMPYDYGEIIGSMGVDGDPVDCFLGNNKYSKFVYVIFQLKKETGEFDEQKTFLGFDDIMDAKEAYRKAYDVPDLFMANWEAIPFDVFKEKVLATKHDPQPIHASQMNTTISLYADIAKEKLAKVGDPVTVDGMHGRGVVVAIDKGRAVIRFRSGEYVSRSLYNIHVISSDYVNQYMSRR
jgi:hypothetical protein